MCFLSVLRLKFTILKFLEINFQIFYVAVSIAFATLTENKTTHYQPGLRYVYFAACCVVFVCLFVFCPTGAAPLNVSENYLRCFSKVILVILEDSGFFYPIQILPPPYIVGLYSFNM